MLIDIVKLEWVGLAVFLFHTLGILAAIHAVMTARTSQGAIAWALLLVLIPYVTLFAYAAFGRGKFGGYVKARRAGDSQIDHIARSLEKKMHLFRVRDEDFDPKHAALDELAEMPFTSHNDAKLLINGGQAFPAMFAGMEDAKEYIIVQFYIVRDDTLGRQLKELLGAKQAKAYACTSSTTKLVVTICRGLIGANWPKRASSSCRSARRADFAIGFRSTFATIARSSSSMDAWPTSAD